MRELDRYNPFVLLFFFGLAAGIAMFSVDPVILTLSFAGSFTLYCVMKKGFHIKEHKFAVIVFLLTALINPLVRHSGVTVLFVLNDNPITLEALVYGITAGEMIVSAMYWFGVFSELMTSDKLLYLFGTLSPKTALLLSMTMRYIPLFNEQVKKTEQVQKALGLYKDDNIIDTVRGKIRIFSVMVTWALENGIITADSMSSRGYGIGKRSYYSEYRMRKSDIAAVSVLFILSAVVIVSAASGALDFDYYPRLGTISSEIMTVSAYAAYAVLVFMLTAVKISEEVKWKYLQSKI